MRDHASHLTVTRKLFAAFAVVLVLSAVVSIVGILQIGSTADPTKTKYYAAAGAIEPIRDTNSRQFEGARDQLSALIALEAGDKATFRSLSKDAIGKLNEGIDDLSAYGATVADPKLKAQIGRYLDLLKSQRTVREEVNTSALADAGAGKLTPARIRKLVQPAVDLMDQADGLSDGLTTTAEQLAKADAGRQKSGADGAKTLMIVLLALALALGFAAAFLIARNIRRPIMEVLARLKSLKDNCSADLSNALNAMTRGDLSVVVTPNTEKIERWPSDEIGEAAQATNEIIDATAASVVAYNTMREQLSTMIGELSRTASTVSAASQQMASSSEETGRVVNEIVSAVGDVAQGAERQVRMVESAKVSAEETASAAFETRGVAEDGVAAANEASQAMQAVRESTQSVTQAIRDLASKSEQIGGIVETITGIAGQTNLLALNAAIEAARAGEQGRGFAVVAEEVRKLAEESQQAAATIAGLIEAIQQETQKTVAIVEDGARRSEDGAAIVERAREAFLLIGSRIEDVGARVAEIVNATTEVAAVAEQSSASTEQVSASTEQTSASAEEIAASAQELARTAEQLEQLVTRFQLAA